MTVVIGVDPGDSTGVAILHDGKLIYAYQGVASDALRLVEVTLQHYTKAGADRIVVACERYVQMHGTRTHQPAAAEMVGSVRAMAGLYGADFVQQLASDAWALVPNDLLRRLGMLQTGRGLQTPDADDGNMAVRHALLYLARTHATIFDQLTKG